MFCSSEFGCHTQQHTRKAKPCVLSSWWIGLGVIQPPSHNHAVFSRISQSLSPFPCFLSVPFRFRNVSCMADSPTLVNARYYLSVHLFYSASPNTNDRWHASRGGQTDLDRQNHHSLMQERGKMKSVQEIDSSSVLCS